MPENESNAGPVELDTTDLGLPGVPGAAIVAPPLAPVLPPRAEAVFREFTTIAGAVAPVAEAVTAITAPQAAPVVSRVFDATVTGATALHGELGGAIADAQAAAANVRDLASAKDILGNILALFSHFHDLFGHVNTAVQAVGVELGAMKGARNE